MEYPLEERIGPPELLVGRTYEFDFIEKWLQGVHKKVSKSTALLARKKSGKTAIVQRMFNQIWSDNGLIVPFYYEVKAKRVWFPDFSEDYYRHFANQYISFIQRDPSFVSNPLPLEDLQQYAEQQGFDHVVRDIRGLANARARQAFDVMWTLCYAAPHAYAASLQRRWVVMIDEFQNLSEYVCTDKSLTIHDASMPGSYHEHAESKIAPMFVTGSYIGWLVSVVNKYLEAGRLRFEELSPYLEESAALESVYRYADYHNVPISNECAVLISTLCQNDPFFVSSVIQSSFRKKNLTDSESVVQTVQYELTNRKSSFSRTWADYIDLSLDRINDIHARRILLFLTKYSDRQWTHQEIQERLQLTLDLKELLRKLIALSEADLIEQGVSDVQFQGLKDGTLYLILRNRFADEVQEFDIDITTDFRQQAAALKQQNRQLQGKLNQLSGKP